MSCYSTLLSCITDFFLAYFSPPKRNNRWITVSYTMAILITDWLRKVGHGRSGGSFGQTHLYVWLHNPTGHKQQGGNNAQNVRVDFVYIYVNETIILCPIICSTYFILSVDSTQIILLHIHWTIVNMYKSFSGYLYYLCSHII